MIDFAVCDDEKIFSKIIADMIGEICSKNNIDYNISTFNSADKLINSCCKYHAIFMDIDMPEIGGIEAAEEINIKKDGNEFPLIIFVSNMDNFVFKALEQYPYSFIRKMYLSRDLERCILKIKSKIANQNKIIYRIKDGRNEIILDLNNIIYLEKEKNYVKFVSEKDIYKERTTVDEKYIEIHKYGFIRVQIGYLVNRKYIFEFQKNTIILTSGKHIPLSKKYRTTTKNEYFEWLVNDND